MVVSVLSVMLSCQGREGGKGEEGRRRGGRERRGGNEKGTNMIVEGRMKKTM